MHSCLKYKHFTLGHNHFLTFSPDPFPHILIVQPLSCVCLVTQSGPTLCDPMDCSLPCSSLHEDSPGKNIGVDCHALLQGIYPTQGSNPGLPYCRQIIYHLSHQGNPNFVKLIIKPRNCAPSCVQLWHMLLPLLGILFSSPLPDKTLLSFKNPFKCHLCMKLANDFYGQRLHILLQFLKTLIHL